MKQKDTNNDIKVVKNRKKKTGVFVFSLSDSTSRLISFSSRISKTQMIVSSSQTQCEEKIWKALISEEEYCEHEWSDVEINKSNL